MNIQTLCAAAFGGDRRALARLLSVVEAGGDQAAAAMDVVYPRSGKAHIVGITGAPGAGKSTLVARLAQESRRQGGTVAIVAVDPSSPFTGGALLGDRVRMTSLWSDPGIFVRSMASRNGHGGLASQTAAIATVLATVFELVLLETVGAGQDELEVAQEAHTTVVVTAPGMGDGVQALKSGILEIADVLVVNKADQDGADQLLAELIFGRGLRPGTASAASAGEPAAGERWAVPVIRTVATTGQGVADLLAAVDAHQRLQASGDRPELAARARALAKRHILRAAATRALRRAEAEGQRSGMLNELVTQVAKRSLSPGAAADRLLDSMLNAPTAMGRAGPGQTSTGSSGSSGSSGSTGGTGAVNDTKHADRPDGVNTVKGTVPTAGTTATPDTSSAESSHGTAVSEGTERTRVGQGSANG